MGEEETYSLGWIGDNVEVYLESLSFNINCDDLLDTDSANDFLELLRDADDVELDFYRGGFRVVSDSIALTFENVECRPGFEIFTITRVDFDWDDLEWLEKKIKEDPEWVEKRLKELEEMEEEEGEEDYFVVYSCPIAQGNYVSHLDPKDIFDDLLEYLDSVIPRIKNVKNRLKVVEQLKVIFTNKKVRLIMPKLSKTFIKLLDQMEKELKKT
jgi:hypothetical protein